MIPALIPQDETSRLATLVSCGILDTPQEDSFGDLARVAAQLCEAPVALVSFVDANRQWFKARVNHEGAERPRRLSICAYAINESGPFVIRDTQADPRFIGAELVGNGQCIRFYAGVPLRVDAGSALGTLCVIDYVPRDLTAAQLGALEVLAGQIARELRLRRRAEGSPAPRRADRVLEVGEVIAARWRIERLIGAGASGAIFEARTEGGARAAVKVLHREMVAHAEIVERFVREARVLRQLRSVHIARMLDVGNLDASKGGLPFIVIEYLEGTDLAALLDKAGRIECADALQWTADACDGLQAAHEKSVVHRDVKPSNVFLAQGTRPQPVVKLLDFGIAKSFGSAKVSPLTGAETLLGTPQYMSPEQLLTPGDIDLRSDIWSIGVVLYELITGRVPFGGQTQMEIFASILSRAPLPMSARSEDLPRGLETIVRRCLTKGREGRFASARELASALRELDLSPRHAPR